ncbi:MAG: HAD family hydrolase [Candidatus Aenigmatarchaeota archaeon]
MTKKIVSFDLDGTLVDFRSFDDVFWYEEMPKLYAKKHGVAFAAARKICLNEYRKVGNRKPEWFRPSFWFSRFSLNCKLEEITAGMRCRVKLLPHAKRTLSKLSKRYKLVIFTHTSRELLDIKMKMEGLGNYFSEVFSVVDDFGMVKDEKAYAMLLKRLGVSPECVTHVGDNYKFDYLIPRSLGITAIYIDRSRKKSGKYIIRSLRVLPALIEKIQ